MADVPSNLQAADLLRRVSQLLKELGELLPAGRRLSSPLQGWQAEVV